MSARKVEQPVVVVCEVCGDEHLKNGKRPICRQCRRRAAAGESRKPALADKTAFACSAWFGDAVEISRPPSTAESGRRGVGGETPGAALKLMNLIAELESHLDDLKINGDTIGDIRRACFVPWDSEWNGIVRDLTAQREQSVVEEGGGESDAESGRKSPND